MHTFILTVFTFFLFNRKWEKGRIRRQKCDTSNTERQDNEKTHYYLLYENRKSSGANIVVVSMRKWPVCLFLCGSGDGDDDNDDAFALLNIRYARFACRSVNLINESLLCFSFSSSSLFFFELSVFSYSSSFLQSMRNRNKNNNNHATQQQQQQ